MLPINFRNYFFNLSLLPIEKITKHGYLNRCMKYSMNLLFIIGS